LTNDLWQQVLAALEVQLPRETFFALLARSKGMLEGDALYVQLASDYAAEWVAARLLPLIQVTVDRVAGRHLTIRTGTAPPTTSLELAPAAQDEDGTEPGRVCVELVEFNPDRYGFVKLSNYAVRFWQPYLGPRPFALWVTLRSFAWNSDREAWPSIQTLADICAAGNRHVILGRGARAERARLTGALEVLEREQIVCVTRRGSGRMKSYAFHVVESLPLLTPCQLERLPQRLADAHAGFLHRHGLSFQDWSQLNCKTLLAGDWLMSRT